MKILLAHNETRPGLSQWYQELAAQPPPGVTVQTFCMTPNPPGPPLLWDDLNRQWELRAAGLMRLYRDLTEAANEADVLLLYNGTNLHPEVLPCLPTFNVYCFFDDPESTGWGSAPLAPKFDAVFYGNIANAFHYQHWGCKKLAFLPIFTAPSDVPKPEHSDSVLQAKRTIDIAFLGELNHYRKQRLQLLARSFPQAECYGSGWPKGKLADNQKHDLYLRAKVSWNVHNSTGPINRRMFELAAYGVLQICDNKTGLGQIFRLDEEAVGFDTIPEAIELTKYYLAHERERQAIVEKAHARYWKDYSAAAIWVRIVKQLEAWGAARKNATAQLPRRSWLRGIRHKLKKKSRAAKNQLPQAAPLEAPAFTEAAYLGDSPAPYIENPEMPNVNMVKERLKNGEPFEWPNIVALNWAITSLLGDAKKIVEIGSGTGAFAEYASVDPSRSLCCVEGDDFARSMAIEKRSRPNVRFFKEFEDCPEKVFDLLVSVEVIEHVADVGAFLEFCKSLAPRAIFSTPNRLVVRGMSDIGPPLYKPHVREYDAGEFYWLLRQHYDQVRLFYQPDVYVPWLAPMTIATHGTPLIAQCWSPS